MSNVVKFPDNEPWLELASGVRWYIRHPNADKVDITDIAGALSKVCRFGGHTKAFYSVAQHLVLCSSVGRIGGKLTDRQLLHVLLHDASEAYLVDMPRPVKQELPAYIEMEKMTEAVIARAFNLTDYDFENGKWPDYVKEIDNRMLITEQRDLMPLGPPYLDGAYHPYQDSVIDLTRKGACWLPDEAESEFYKEFNRIVKRLV